MPAPYWMKAESMDPCGLCLYKHLTNVILGHSVGILSMDLATILLPSQYLITLASNLDYQTIMLVWGWGSNCQGLLRGGGGWE